MQLRWMTAAVLVFVTRGTAAPPVQLELATERGLQITAPQEWLQRFARAGIENVRIRGATPGDKPSLTNRGSEERPAYHLVGILTARQELLLPGASFRPNEMTKLRDYLDRLAADGPDAILAPRGQFGLTEKQFNEVHKDLSQPIRFSTESKSLNEVLREFEALLSHKIIAPPTDDEPVADEVRDFTAGTGLAIVLRDHGLAMVPVKPRGKGIVYKIVPFDSEQESWPVGWKPAARPREVAPALFEFLNVQIEDYSLRETLDAIQPRAKIPFFLDHRALAEHKIDPDEVQVAIPQTRTFLKRVLDNSLSQAHLHGQLRVDEAEKPFYWISK